MTSKYLPIVLCGLGLALFTAACKSESRPKAEPTMRTTRLDQQRLTTVLDSVYGLYPQSIGIIAHIESDAHELSWTAAAGHAERDTEHALTPDRPVLIASNIKTYVAAAVLRLQESGALDIEDPIAQHLTEESTALFESDGYDFGEIKVKHLLSHTSGIADYVNQDYLDFINENHQYRWTREEQLRLATEVADPLGPAQSLFQYADVNYLLATEIIEQHSGQPFYTAMRELLKYEELGLQHTWFPTLEPKPAGTAELAHQYWREEGWGESGMDVDWDSYEHDISWDLYGGGGIATTVAELARFNQHLFSGRVIAEQGVLELLKTDVPTTDGEEKNYRLGIAQTEMVGFESYSHGGFWGTISFYLPELDATIALCVLERKDKMTVIGSSLEALTSELAAQLDISPAADSRAE